MPPQSQFNPDSWQKMKLCCVSVYKNRSGSDILGKMVELITHFSNNKDGVLVRLLTHHLKWTKFWRETLWMFNHSANLQLTAIVNNRNWTFRKYSLKRLSMLTIGDVIGKIATPVTMWAQRHSSKRPKFRSRIGGKWTDCLRALLKRMNGFTVGVLEEAKSTTEMCFPRLLSEIPMSGWNMAAPTSPIFQSNGWEVPPHV